MITGVFCVAFCWAFHCLSVADKNDHITYLQEQVVSLTTLADYDIKAEAAKLIASGRADP